MSEPSTRNIYRRPTLIAIDDVPVRYRDLNTGEFVSQEYAEANPLTTAVEPAAEGEQSE